MPVTTPFEAHHALTYANNVMMVAQQLRNPLRGAVTEVSCKGEAHSAADLIGSVEPISSNLRSRTNPETRAATDRRWLILPDMIEAGDYIDNEDRFQTLYDPTAPLVRTYTAAVDRVIGDRILGVSRNSDGTYSVTGTGILGGANSGKRPGTISALPAGNYVAHGSAGLNLDKLIEARERLNLAEFGMEPGDDMYCAITPKQVTNLLDIAAQTQTNLNAFQLEQLRTGQPTSLLGFQWVVTNRLPKNGAGNRLCPVWSKRNIAMGVWQDIKGDMWLDTHAKKLPYVHVSALVDCVRVQDGGVQVIECVES